MSSRYIPGPLIEEDDPNPIVIPKQAKRALGPHRYNPNLSPDGKRIGYERVEYDRDGNEYPKTLYHTDYGLKPKPDAAQYTRGLAGHEALESALIAFNSALQKWERGNRIKTAQNKKEEEKLVKIGWLTQPPKRDVADTFNHDSDQL